jgi:hypothetical protein
VSCDAVGSRTSEGDERLISCRRRKIRGFCTRIDRVTHIFLVRDSETSNTKCYYIAHKPLHLFICTRRQDIQTE